MPRIHDYVKDCIVYCYPSADCARDGEQFGGTGFLISIPLPNNPGLGATFAVTNVHVCEGAPVIRVNRRDGTPAIVPLTKRHWIKHPAGDDIAMAPIWGINEVDHRITTIAQRTFLTQQKMAELDYGIGDDVFFVGRFLQTERTSLNDPSLRFGNIAQMPTFIHQGDRDFDQESFLIEARSISGQSGSPVWVHMLPMSARPKPDDPAMIQVVPWPGNGPWLLGVDWGHLHDRQEVHGLGGNPVDPPYVHSNSGMMGVVPIWKLDQILELEGVREMIKKLDEHITKKKQSSGSSMDVKLPKPDVDAAFEKTVKAMLDSPPSPHSTKAKAKRTRATKEK